ncbi:MAG: alpha/beta hydrolase [Alphaproteobacteria bacterium]|nr:alpha/beta hydrolase [Alphaproteobacteria bacterium]MBV9372322.1 alpha/beta hydrolase [Alphaproteobacteria bacterium]MBV9899614.1 alpha/beta hydrolase [Alphaproteobacteria bacterium]
MFRKLVLGAALALTAAAPASAATPTEKPVIVLVHGAFADAASWQRVIPILQRDGYEVTAVENPLQSLASDVEWTKRVVDAQARPVVLVGHSYGGAVITGAAAGDPKVKALVYVAAFGPEAGEPIGAFGEKYPVKLGAGLRPDTAGFLYIDRGQFRELFAADLPAADVAVLAASQKPVKADVFGASVPQAAWKTIPSWYIVATEDHAINPDLERFYAKRMGATTVEIKSSHVPFVSNPEKVARVIEEAAQAASR